MRAFSVIGTAHLSDAAMLSALVRTLEALDPDQLIVEVPDAIVTAGDLAGQKPEMAAACRWAQGRGTPVRGHEPAGHSVLRETLAPEQIAALIEDMDRLVAKLPVARVIDIFCDRAAPNTAAEARLRKVIDELIDPIKSLARTQAIIKTVQEVSAPSGHIVILCGGSHAPHLAETLENCRIVAGEHFY